MDSRKRASVSESVNGRFVEFVRQPGTMVAFGVARVFNPVL